MAERIATFGDFWQGKDGHYLRPGTGWDGLTRAFEHFGHSYIAVNMRRDGLTFEQVAKVVNAFGASVWWIRVKEGLAFLAWWYGQGYPRPELVVYHFCDLRAPENTASPWPVKRPVIDPESVHGLIDVLFLVNSGQLAEYQDVYSIPDARFLPHYYVPGVLGPVDMPKVHDVGFVGKLDGSLYHRERTETILRLKGIFGDRMAIRVSDCHGQDLARFYSQCEIVLGAGSGVNVKHCTSDRFALALGCGAFYLYQHFDGCYDLMPEGTAVPWHDEKSLIDLIKFYLADDKPREVIARCGHQLALDQYTHLEVIGQALRVLGV